MMKKFFPTLIAILLIVGVATALACKAPAKFEVISINIVPSEAAVGQIVTITTGVRNSGGSKGTYTVALTIDGQEIERKNVFVAVGAIEAVVFTVVKNNPGTYNVKVDGLSSTLRVLKPAEFVIANLAITPAIAEPGQVVTVAIDVSNVGEVEGSYIAILTIDGTEIEKKSIIVAPRATKTVTFSVIKDKAAKYRVAIGELSSDLVVKDSELIFIEKIWTIPDYTQTDPAYGGLPGSGMEYCAPVSVSNSLMWLSDNGFPNLTPRSNDRKRDQFEVARLLGSPTYMDTKLTDERRGTGPNGLCRGLKRYILDRGYIYKRLETQGWRYVDVEFRTGVDVPDLEWVKRGIKGYGSVFLNIGLYTYNPVTDEYTRVGGHWITLVGYGHDGKSPNPDYLIAHDPSPPTFRNEYILPVRINSGTLKGTYSGLPRNAAGLYKMTGMVISPKADLGILDVAVILEMQP